MGSSFLATWWQTKPFCSRSAELTSLNPDDIRLRLGDALPISGRAIQVAKRGASRQAQDSEAAALLIGALATMARNSGVSTLNVTSLDGRPMALAIIENARFEEEYGETVLSSRR